MNAYKLADKLESFWLTKNDDLLIKAVTMLRQQADRIAELEKNLHMIQRHYDQLNTQTKPLSDEEIHELIVNKVTDYEFARAIEERHGIK